MFSKWHNISSIGNWREKEPNPNAKKRLILYDFRLIKKTELYRRIDSEVRIMPKQLKSQQCQ
jgi:hypothetical protein